MSRYIDADALKKAFEEVYPLATNEMGGAVNKRIYDIIDNAPTVFTQEDIDNVLELAYISGQQHPERPKGKWIIGETYDCHSDIVKTYTCPFCGKKEYSNYPYCHCGADMRGNE